MSVIPGSAQGQAAIAAVKLDADRLPLESRLTLRPSTGLEELAARVARVLTLRTGAQVDVGDNPPPGLLEAVPAGHIALARENGQVRLVLGAAMGRSFEATVQLSDDQGASDVRSVALAVEALRDRAIEARGRFVEGARSPEARVVSVPTDGTAQFENTMLHAPARDTGAPSALERTSDRRLQPVRPLVYLRAYSGASSESSAPRMGVGAGGGLCVLGNCWLLTVEYPVPFSTQPGGDDVRYRYMTFTSGVYLHPFTFGRFTPGASAGFLTRIGHFERDMGLPDAGGLDTDLGARATLEGAFEVMPFVDALAEVGVDFALDRWRLGHGDAVAYRGQRVTPWLQGGIRVRAY